MTKARLIRLAAVALIAAGVLVGGFAYWGYRVSVAPGPLHESKTIIVTRGSGLRDIANQLAAAGIIAHPRVFQIMTWLKRAQRDLRAGEYAFDAGVSMRGVMGILREGRTVVRHVTFPEGLTSKEIVAELRRTDGLTGKIRSVPSEGSLLPNTYHYSYGDTRAEMISRMAKAMDATLTALWAKRAPDLPLKSPTEALILASIVEKETAIPAERPRIAAVFINRLEKGMRIESDPTVVYALTHGAGPLGRPLTREDLKIDRPYNTYRIDGLPPGPICNPGKDSLAAVMNPLKTDELYFVADGSGGHVFARTLKEHNRNVAKWRAFKRANAKKH